MKHAMSVMTDKIDDNEETKPQISKDKEMEYCQSEKALPVEEEDDENVQKTENDKENNDEENKLKPIEELLTVPKVSATIKQSEDSSNVDPPSSVELARTPSETPSSEINLQFPPSPLKRARRDDDQHIRSAGADVLLPMLIFTVVKSNPHKFVSNLKFIQRYRMASRISGEASYCLTNMASIQIGYSLAIHSLI
jgi:hypothetical protein